MSAEVMYGSHPYYPNYSEYNSNNIIQNPEQHDQLNGYFNYSQDATGYQQIHSQQQIDPPTDESLNPLQHLNYPEDWTAYGGYEPYNSVNGYGGNWQAANDQQQQSCNEVPSHVFSNQVVNSNNVSNQQTTNYTYLVDELPISDLVESVYNNLSLPPSSSTQSQPWSQSNPNSTDAGHRPSNQFNNLVPTVVDQPHHESSTSYSQAVPYHLQDSATPSALYQELNNNNLVSTSTNYLVPAPGYVSSQLESSTLPDVTTTQSQPLHVSPISSASPLTDPLTSDPSSLVLQVHCFKCKLCDFISLNKSNVLSHIDTSHKSSGQMLTVPIVNEPSLVLSATTGGIDSLNRPPTQGPQFLAPGDINCLLNESVTIAAGSVPNSNPAVTSKLPTVKIAPKVMPPILVHQKQTKSSAPLSSFNPSNQTSGTVTSIVIDTGVTSLKSKNKSRSNHSKRALIRIEQGNRMKMGKSFLKSKDDSKSLKSSSVTKIKIKEEDIHWFQCEYKKCTAKYESLNNLERHMNCHIPGDELGYKCSYCKTFTSQYWSSMAGHLWREHAVDLELHKCESCNYRSYSLSILENQHKRIHSNEKNYCCDLCSKCFKNNKQLVNHRVRHSKPQVPVIATVRPEDAKKPECENCNKAFKDRRALMVHMNSVHKKKRPYVCSSCGHRASSRSALKTHIRSHTGEKPFKCDQCDYSTSDHNSLRRHRMRHSGERPYKCPFCDYACIQSSTYKQHLRNKHPGQIEGYMFACSCGFKTVNSENYSSHVRERGANCGFDRSLGRSDGESSSYSSSSSPATPALNGPESPDMHLARGILGVSSVKDLHSLKRSSSSSMSTSSEDDSSLGATMECIASIAVTHPNCT